MRIYETKRVGTGFLVRIMCQHCKKLYWIRRSILDFHDRKSCSWECKEKYRKPTDHPGYLHGKSRTRIHRIWALMKNRCTNQKRNAYNRYGGRGITVCKEWLDFRNFDKDMGKSYNDHVKLYGEKETTLDRIDNNKNYSKQNCKWSTWKEQFSNRRYNKK